MKIRGSSRKIKVCLTGGPSAGKTTVIDIIRREFIKGVQTVPEAASILFKGGFPRFEKKSAIKCAQRAIYFTQIEMERMYESVNEVRLLFCDRGTLDHPAYWPDEETDFFKSVHSSVENEVARYDFVIHLQTSALTEGFEQSSVRIETPQQALALDLRILESWRHHPNRVIIPSRLSFHDKIDTVFNTLEKCLRVKLNENPFQGRRVKDNRYSSLLPPEVHHTGP